MKPVVRNIKEEIAQVKRRWRIIGRSSKLDRAIEIAIRVAPSDVTVLVLGESGTGKEVFGQIIHSLSHRRHQPYMAINCGAIPEGTLDSELFGHERGAFTSAYESRKGYFEEANGGTLFLDEIGEMPLHTQARLLRVLETGEFLRVGSSKVRKTDVRIVAATNKNLLQRIREGKFREDLYYRLNTVTIYMPPLRERGEDVILLFEYFALEFAEKYYRPVVELTDDAKQLLLSYHWPGNVRELKNLVEKVTILSPRTLVDAALLKELYNFQEAMPPVLLKPSTAYQEMSYALNEEPVAFRNEPLATTSLTKAMLSIKKDLEEIKQLLARNPVHVLPAKQQEEEEDLSLEANERRLIVKALKRFYGSRKKAAKALGISERTLYRKIRAYGIDEKEFMA